MRLIDADALIERLKGLALNECFHEDFLYTIIVNAPTIQCDGWLSVEDKMPEYEQAKQRRVRVLVTWKETNAVFTLWYGHRFGYNSPSFFEEYEWTESDLGFIDENDNPFLGETLTYSTITHWQPLPASPTGKE